MIPFSVSLFAILCSVRANFSSFSYVVRTHEYHQRGIGCVFSTVLLPAAICSNQDRRCKADQKTRCGLSACMMNHAHLVAFFGFRRRPRQGRGDFNSLYFRRSPVATAAFQRLHRELFSLKTLLTTCQETISESIKNNI